MRILVTGSRDWTDKITIYETLSQVWVSGEYNMPTLVSGACPTGADRMAEEYAEAYNWNIELHPAEWEKYGKRAGFLRNKEMVDLGADICLAFIKNNSKGASMTLKLAEEAGMSTKVFRDDS
jgi:hypothetical protein